MFPSPTLRVPTNHWIVGGGVPVAEQVKVAVAPSLTVMSTGAVVIVGITVNTSSHKGKPQY